MQLNKKIIFLLLFLLFVIGCSKDTDEKNNGEDVVYTSGSKITYACEQDYNTGDNVEIRDRIVISGGDEDVFFDDDCSCRISHILKHLEDSSVDQLRFYPDLPICRGNFLTNIFISTDNGTLKKSNFDIFKVLLDNRIHDVE